MAGKEPASREAPGSSAPLRYRLLIAAAVVFAVFLGFHRWPVVTSEPGGSLTDPDALFHVRRVVRTIESRTLLPPVFDAFENFPEGGRAVWPPLHDAVLAVAARLGGSTPSEPRKGLLFTAAVPVAELAAIVALLALLVGKAGSESGAALAAWLAALTPAFVRRCSFGEVDHNATEILGWVLLLLLTIGLSRRKTPAWRTDLLLAASWGGAVLLALGFQAGLILAAGVLSAGVAVLEFSDRESGGLLLSRLSFGYALAAVSLPFLAALRVQPDPADPWRLGPVYSLILALAAGAFGLVSAVFGLRAGVLGRARHALAGLGILTGAACAALSPSGAWTGLLRGLGFVGSRDPWLSTIDEFQPLVFSRLSLFATAPALPAGLTALALILAWKQRRSSIRAWLVPATAFILLAVLAIAQKRFVPVAAVFGALTAGVAWKDLALETVRRRALLGVAGVCLLTTADYTPSYVLGTLGQALGGETTPRAVARAIAEVTPLQPAEPSWGILAPWDFGHVILGRSGRAVALNNFGNWHPGFARKARILLEGSPVRAVAEMEALRLRYIAVTWPGNVVPSAVTSLGLSEAAFEPVPPIGDGLPVSGTGSALERTLAVRLFVRDGRPYEFDSPADRAALLRFRKVWQMPPAPDVPFPDAKLFELMPAGG